MSAFVQGEGKFQGTDYCQSQAGFKTSNLNDLTKQPGGLQLYKDRDTCSCTA